MRTSVVEYEDGARAVRIVVCEDTAIVGMKRTILQRAADVWLQKQAGVDSGAAVDLASQPDSDEVPAEEVPAEEVPAEEVAERRPRQVSQVEETARWLVARVVYPDLLAAAVDADGLNLDMGIDEFIGLPAGLRAAWEDAVYGLNPQWLPEPAPATEQEAAELKKG
jgi:hypothetical protein